MTDLLPVTVKRSTWYRGHGPADSRLLTRDGRRCCLGFAANAAGLRDTSIIDVPNVWDVFGSRKLQHPVLRTLDANQTEGLPRTARYGDTVTTGVQALLIMINDDPRLDDDEREAYLIRYGEFAYIVFTFED